MAMTLSLKAKTILPVTVILVIVMIALAVYNYVSEVSLINDEATATLRSALVTAQNKISTRLNSYQEMAALVAGMPTVTETFAKGDRDRLAAEFAKGFDLLKREFMVAQFQFHKPPAISFLRLHMVGKYGDDLSSFRNTVLYANQEKGPAAGVEVGRGGIGLRGVEPVFSRGGHIGSVEVGGDIVSPVAEVKKSYDVEVGIVLTKEATSLVWEGVPKNVPLIGDYASFHASNPELTRGIVRPEMFAGARKVGDTFLAEQAYYGGRSFDVALSPLKDYNGKTIGFLYALRDRTPLLNKTRTALLINIGVSLLTLCSIIAVINFGLKTAVLDPVFALVKASEDISMGRLTDKVEIKGARGELLTLAKSVDRMRVSMKKLLE